MQIYGPSQVHTAQPISAPHASRPSRATEVSGSAPIHDELSLSETARLAAQAQQLPEIRQDRVDAIRAQIAAGTYESADKLDLALERLLDEIG